MNLENNTFYIATMMDCSNKQQMAVAFMTEQKPSLLDALKNAYAKYLKKESKQRKTERNQNAEDDFNQEFKGLNEV